MTMTIAIAASGFERATQSDARSRTRHAPFDAAQIVGNFSLIDGGPITISAVSGVVVRATKGSLWVSQHQDRKDHFISPGQKFVADRAGPIVISALGIAELHLEWPSRDTNRLSPGLELAN
jgi:hypothetical protein